LGVTPITQFHGERPTSAWEHGAGHVLGSPTPLYRPVAQSATAELLVALVITVISYRSSLLHSQRRINPVSL